MAPYFQPTEIFKKSLQEKYSNPISFQDVDLRQSGTTKDNQLDESVVQLLLSRHIDVAPRLVVAMGPPAIEFWPNNRSVTFPDALFVGMARESFMRQAQLQAGDAAVATQFSFTGMAENILRLRPETSLIVMVFGDSRSERALSAAALRELEPYSDRFSLEFTNDLAIHEIQEKLASLPSDAAVFFGIFSRDRNGVTQHHYSGLDLAKAASKVPVFGAFDDQPRSFAIG